MRHRGNNNNQAIHFVATDFNNFSICDVEGLDFYAHTPTYLLSAILAISFA
jgi:hypothetical protein